MSIKVGDQIPNAKLKIMTPDGPSEISTGEIFDGKTVVLFAVPGAFTPTCHHNHLPGFLENYDQFASKGVDTIAVVGVNDVFVMDAWAKASNGEGKILYLADGNADFTKTVGMELDATAAGLGIRSKRYAMVVKDGVVQTLKIEDAPGSASVSGAASILEDL